MRILMIVCAAVLLGGCGSFEYREDNIAGDKKPDPHCVSRPSQPGEPVSRVCEREGSLRWSTERESRPVDFKRTRDDR